MKLSAVISPDEDLRELGVRLCLGDSSGDVGLLLDHEEIFFESWGVRLRFEDGKPILTVELRLESYEVTEGVKSHLTNPDDPDEEPQLWFSTDLS